MKRYGNLFDRIADMDNILLAFRKAAKKRKWRRSIVRAEGHHEELAAELRETLLQGRYRSSRYTHKIVRDPKTRTIYSLPFYPDRVLHHAVMNILEPIWDRLLDDACHSCRKGKGCHSASRRCMEYARKYAYVYQGDMSKFYPSMDHGIIKKIVRKKIKDSRLLDLLDEIIESSDTIPGAVRGKNAPVGNLLSQWFGNLYLNEMDLWLRTDRGVGPYVRYCDDFLIFSNDRGELMDLRERIAEFAAERLKLRLSRERVFPVGMGIDFVGYRHFPKYVLVRKRVAKKIKRFARRAAAGKYGDFTRTRGRIAAYNGVMAHANARHLRESLDFDSLMDAYGVGRR